MIKTLRIQLTEECNFNCVYCCNEGTKNEYSILKNRNLEAFIRAAHDVLGIKRVKFTGGEPLEYDEDLCKLIRSVDRPEINYSIVTNATDYSACRRLVDEFPNTEVTISLPVPPNEKNISVFKQITGAIHEKQAFHNIINCIEYLLQTRSPFKINYVLCKDMNTSSDYVKEMIRYAQQHPQLQLRFLETIVNSTNNKNNRMSRFVFTQMDFEAVLEELGYGESVRNKILDKRSSCIYDLNGCTVKFIKSFCNDDCENCPEDKTSLWLTSTGCVKKCAYRSFSVPIENWLYNRIALQLSEFI